MNDTYPHESIWINLLNHATWYYKKITGYAPSYTIIKTWERLSYKQMLEFTNINLRQVWLICVIPSEE